MRQNLLIELHGYAPEQRCAITTALLLLIARVIARDCSSLGIHVTIMFEYFDHHWPHTVTDENDQPMVYVKLVCIPFDGHVVIESELRKCGFRVLVQHLDDWCEPAAPAEKGG